MSEISTDRLAKIIADHLRPFYSRWLKLSEAAAYSGIGKHRLIHLAESGKIRGFQDPDSGKHDWIFDRESIDLYRENQSNTLKNKALEILRRL